MRNLEKTQEVKDLKDIILNNINETTDLIFTIKPDCDMEVFIVALKELIIDGYKIYDGVEEDNDNLSFYIEGKVSKGTIILKTGEETEEEKVLRRVIRLANNLTSKQTTIQQDKVIDFETLKSEKFEEMEALYIRQQEIIKRGELFYPKGSFFKSLRPMSNSKKGDTMECIKITFRIYRLIYEVLIKIPRLEKQSLKKQSQN